MPICCCPLSFPQIRITLKTLNMLNFSSPTLCAVTIHQKYDETNIRHPEIIAHNTHLRTPNTSTPTPNNTFSMNSIPCSFFFVTIFHQYTTICVLLQPCDSPSDMQHTLSWSSVNVGRITTTPLHNNEYINLIHTHTHTDIYIYNEPHTTMCTHHAPR